jgi:hypothetical protein
LDLAKSIWERFQSFRGYKDLDEVIRLYDEILFCTPEGHALKVERLTSIGAALRERFEKSGRVSILIELSLYLAKLLLFLTAMTAKNRSFSTNSETLL